MENKNTVTVDKANEKWQEVMYALDAAYDKLPRSEFLALAAKLKVIMKEKVASTQSGWLVYAGFPGQSGAL